MKPTPHVPKIRSGRLIRDKIHQAVGYGDDLSDGEPLESLYDGGVLSLIHI